MAYMYYCSVQIINRPIYNRDAVFSWQYDLNVWTHLDVLENFCIRSKETKPQKKSSKSTGNIFNSTTERLLDNRLVHQLSRNDNIKYKLFNILVYLRMLHEGGPRPTMWVTNSPAGPCSCMSRCSKQNRHDKKCRQCWICFYITLYYINM